VLVASRSLDLFVRTIYQRIQFLIRNKVSINPRVVFGTVGSATKRRVPHPPGFLLSLLGSANFMRLSLEKGAHAVLSSAAWQESGSFALSAKGGIRDGRYRDSWYPTLRKSAKDGAPCNKTRFMPCGSAKPVEDYLEKSASPGDRYSSLSKSATG
jgi:hypothetical protein